MTRDDGSPTTRTVVNRAATEAAQGKADEIRRQMSQAAHGQDAIPDLDPTPRGIDADTARVRALPLGDTRRCRVASPSTPPATYTGTQRSDGRTAIPLH